MNRIYVFAAAAGLGVLGAVLLSSDEAVADKVRVWRSDRAAIQTAHLTRQADGGLTAMVCGSTEFADGGATPSECHPGTVSFPITAPQLLNIYKAGEGL